MLFLPVADIMFLGCGFQEANTIDVHEVKAYGYFYLFIKYALGIIWYYHIFYLLHLVADYFDFQIWNTGSIDVLIYPNIFSQNWHIL